MQDIRRLAAATVAGAAIALASGCGSGNDQTERAIQESQRQSEEARKEAARTRKQVEKQVDEAQKEAQRAREQAEKATP